MKVKIKYTAQLKKAIGKAEEIVELHEESTLKEILNNLNKQYREAFLNIVFNYEGEFMDSVLLVLNGKQVKFTHHEPLCTNDVIMIMSPIAGG